MAHIDLKKYFVEEKEHETGRPRYNREKLLKIVLFSLGVWLVCSFYTQKVIHKQNICQKSTEDPISGILRFFGLLFSSPFSYNRKYTIF